MKNISTKELVKELVLRETSTKELVEELRLREGVCHKFVNPDQRYGLYLSSQNIVDNGPVRILIVED